MVTATYLDASAAMKLIVEEAESAALLAELTTTRRRFVASWLLHTELHLGVDEVVTYDGEFARAASAAGVRVIAPR